MTQFSEGASETRSGQVFLDSALRSQLVQDSENSTEYKGGNQGEQKISHSKFSQSAGRNAYLMPLI